MKKRIFALCAVLALSLSLLSGCAKPDSNGFTPPKEEKDADLAAFAQTLQENHEFAGFLEKIDPNDAEMGEFMGEMLNNYFPGLTDLELEQLEVYMSMVSFSTGEFALAQAKDTEGAAKLQDIFDARVESKSTEGAGNYPEEVELWQRSARVVGHGNYVMLVCHEDADAIVDEFNTLFA